MEKKPIDRIRESGGHFEVGTNADGAVTEMVNVNDRLIIIKEGAVYEAMMADDVDPNRTNINLPNGLTKLLINQGASSEIVSRVFLTAKVLFRKEFFKGIDIEKIINLSIEITNELIVLEDEINVLLKDENQASCDYEESRKQPSNFLIPSVNNLETRCKTIFQKVDHIEQLLMEIIIIFYPQKGFTKQSHLPKLKEVLSAEYGEEDGFVLFLSRALEFARIARELRNGLDHRLNTVVVKNFDIQADASIISPTIELNHKEVKLERVSLSYFLPIVLQNMLTIVETSFACLASRKSNGHLMAYEVREIPEAKRRNKYVKFCFWSPLGEGGYYNQ